MSIFEHHARRIGRSILDVLYPPLCIGCRSQVAVPGAYCATCWANIGFLDGPSCARCGLPFELDTGPETQCATCLAHPPAFDRARAVMRYDGTSRGPILALKHADRLELAPAFAKWLHRVGADMLAVADLIVPVPLHASRLWSRRYNQSAELGRALSKLAAKPVVTDLLSRIRATPSQGAMPSAKARRRNVRGAFQVPPDKAPVVKDRAILVIDDVLTTGATVDACAQALKRAGAIKVDVLALARVVRPRDGLI